MGVIKWSPSGEVKTSRVRSRSGEADSVEMAGYQVHERAWQGHRSLTSERLRRPHRPVPAELLPNRQRRVREIERPDPYPGHLTPSQTEDSAEEHHGAVRLASGVRYGGDLPGGERPAAQLRDRRQLDASIG